MARSALALALVLAPILGSCVGDAPPGEPEPPRPFPQPPTGPLIGYGRCEDGMLYHVFSPLGREHQPPHSAGATLGRCPGACGSAVVECSDPACSNAATLCDAPPSLGKACALEGASCGGTGTVSCPETTPCNGTFSGSTCTCTLGFYRCTPKPELAAVHASLVGKWRGTVDPPEFSQPYAVSLWIYPDGTYWAECEQEGAPCTAFYYGGDGPLPARTISVAETTPAGAYADIVVFQGQQTGAISDLVVAGDALTFTYRAVWHSCDQPFAFTLARE